MRDSEIIEGIVDRFYSYSGIDTSEYSIIFHINDIGNEQKFSMLSDALDKIGATAFTNDIPDKEIIVIWNHGIGSSRKYLRLAMFLATLFLVLYTGYVYYNAYYGGSTINDMEYGALLYTMPVFVILFVRELGKLIALRGTGTEYNFPIFLPSPGLGTLGMLNSNNNKYKSSSSLMKAGSYSLFFGFFSSLFIIILGSLIIPSNVTYSSLLKSPINALGFPLIYKYILDRIIYNPVAPNPLVLAGYTGLITTAINGIPLGFLDGGLVFTGLMGRKFKYISYASTAVLLLASIIYPELIILVAVSLILGIKGSQPMNNISPPSKSIRYAAAVVLIIVVLGFAPVHFHSNETVSSVPSNNSFMVNSTDPANITVNITVNDPSGTVPRFSVTPGNLSVKGVHILNRTASIYNIEIYTAHRNYSGNKTYDISVFMGRKECSNDITVYFVKPLSGIKINNKSINEINVTAGKMFNISINQSVNAIGPSPSIVSLSGNAGIYQIFMIQNRTNELEIPIVGENMFGTLIDKSMIQHKLSANMTLHLLAERPGSFKIMLLSQNNTALIMTINVSAGNNTQGSGYSGFILLINSSENSEHLTGFMSSLNVRSPGILLSRNELTTAFSIISPASFQPMYLSIMEPESMNERGSATSYPPAEGIEF